MGIPVTNSRSVIIHLLNINQMTKILKVIGLLLWIGSGMLLVTAMFTNYANVKGVPLTTWDFLIWIFLLVFICMSPWYLWTIFSNTLFLSEKKIRELKLELQKKMYEYNDAAVGYSQATKKCFQDIQDLKDYLKVKSKEEKIKEIDALFDNTPLDSSVQRIRTALLQYIERNG